MRDAATRVRNSGHSGTTGLGYMALLAAAASGVAGCNSGDAAQDERIVDSDVVDVASDANDSGSAADGDAADVEVADSRDDANTPDASTDAELDATQLDADAGDTSDGSGAPFVFVEYLGRDEPADVRTERLCVESADPDAAPDHIDIDCALEGARLAPADPAPVDSLLVMTWNIERGVRTAEQLALLTDDDQDVLPRPDLLLLSEVDRGCSRSGYRDVARDYAEALGMNYVFAVEFIELPRGSGSGGSIGEQCEHGNAILSRFPIGNAVAIRHTNVVDWYLPPGERESGEPRLGGRVLVCADIEVGARYVHACSLHYESDPRWLDTQIQQAIETAEHANAQPHAAIIGGDTNNVAYALDVSSGRAATPGEVLDLTIGALIELGFHDALRDEAASLRPTRFGLVLDLLLANDDAWSEGRTCPAEVCTPELSDHRAVWARFTLR
jgi:endonuclease/exonuclease/phosphatase family metal-dependent hydrolase